MKSEPEREDEVRFFNISLMNANVMSTPKFPQPQRLIGELIHSLEFASPAFAWVQFLFKRANLSHTLVALKNSIQSTAAMIKTPEISWISGAERDRKELHRDWYGRSGERVKKIDAVVNTPHVLLGIQGMWVGDSQQLSMLPFKDCYDEHDRLGVFVYRNPRMLVELVERRMVEDISSYLMSYSGSRLEPPSFVITPEEVPYYVHLPVAKEAKSMKSLTFVQHSPVIGEGEVEGGEARKRAGPSRVLRLTKIPLIREPLKEKDTERLSLLPSSEARSFEVLFERGKTELLVSSDSEQDLGGFVSTLESVYGELNPIEAPYKPAFLSELPGIVGLLPPSSVKARPPSPSQGTSSGPDSQQQRHVVPHAGRWRDGKREDQRHPLHA